MSSGSLKQSIRLLFRLKYLRDVILRPTIEDTGVSALNSMIRYHPLTLPLDIDYSHIISILSVLLSTPSRYQLLTHPSLSDY